MSLYIPSIDTKIQAIMDNQIVHDLNIPVIKRKGIENPKHPNAHVAEKYDHYLRDMYTHNIVNAKPMVDTSRPTYARQPSRKAAQMSMERQRETDNQNAKLQYKISSIKTSIPKPNNTNQVLRDRLKSHRVKEQTRIDRENMKLQERINQARNKPARTWKDDRQRNLEYLKSISKYPRKFYVESELLEKTMKTRLE